MYTSQCKLTDNETASLRFLNFQGFLVFYSTKKKKKEKKISFCACIINAGIYRNTLFMWDLYVVVTCCFFHLKFILFLTFILLPFLDDIRLFCPPIHLIKIKFQHSDTVTFESKQVWWRMGVSDHCLLAPFLMLYWSSSEFRAGLMLMLLLILNQSFHLCLPVFIRLKQLRMSSSLLKRAKSANHVSCAACVSCHWFVFCFVLVSLLCILCFFSGYERPFTSTKQTTAVLRRTEAELGARAGRLHGNGLIWQYQKKAWYVSQIKKQWKRALAV